METIKRNGIPIYHQLKEDFIEKIKLGEWQAGEIIPTEEQLCKQYNVSRGPVQKAIEQLVRDGLLNRKQGIGTRVLPPKLESGLGGFSSFTTIIESKGLKHSSQLLSVKLINSNKHTSNFLEINIGEPIFKIVRLKFADDEPLILETLHVPEVICPNLDHKDLQNEQLYSILTDNYRIPLIGSKQSFEPVIIDEYEAGLLKIKSGSPALLVWNITYTEKAKPIVVSKSIFRGDRVRFYIESSGPLLK